MLFKSKKVNTPDGFELTKDHPYFAEHELLSEFLNTLEEFITAKNPRKLRETQTHEIDKLLQQPDLNLLNVTMASCERTLWLRQQADARILRWHMFHEWHYAMRELRSQLLRRKLPFETADIKYLFDFLKDKQDYYLPGQALVHIERYAANHELDDEMIDYLTNWAHEVAYDHKTVRRLEKLLGQGIQIKPGEKWSDAWLQADETLDDKARENWSTLLTHAAQSSASKPAAKWLNAAIPLIEQIGAENFAVRLGKMLRDIATSSDSISASNADILKGLIWCAPLVENAELCRALGDAIPQLFKTIEHKHEYDYGGGVTEYSVVNSRAPSLGNAAIYALSQMQSASAVTHLARARLKLRHGGALKAIEKALNEVAKRLNVSSSDLEELAVPEFGLESGVLARQFGEWTAEIDFHSGKALWTWRAENKKPPKTVPAAVKAEYSSELKQLKAQAAEIEKLFPAQKDRLDLLLREEKTWPLSIWRERYLQHPFLSLIANRVIWEWSDDSENWHAFLPQETWIDLNGDAAPAPENALIRLWHPIRHSADEVLAWRRLLEEKQIRQPFKQAHREVYLLTDAERSTRIYSNRFAAHIMRQHQFNALCATRGWKNKLRLMVDDVAPPATKELPQHNLRAEFWIEGAGTEYSIDTNETGTFYRLVTDQVRFYRMSAAQNWAHVGGGGYAQGSGWRGDTGAIEEPVPLEEIPPLVFSEVMRDVDLFVGVASVGNDPAWSDGGPQGRYVNYWQEYSFGELSQTAQTRRDVLSRLLPKLKIKERCELRDRFLIVRGDLRTYKIHLGSGNILMEPNDQYLCIVPSRSASTSDNLFLPFEGDGTMSVILSKAFLLTEDTKITDATITSQINAK